MMIPDLPKNTIVYSPEELETNNWIGNIYGFYQSESEIYNILTWNEADNSYFTGLNIQRLGSIINDSDTLPTPSELVGIRSSEGVKYFIQNKKCTKEIYNLTRNIFSRNTGILETDWMLEKRAFIIGCGSVGSLVALELAKAGVGNFFLVDNDIIAFHNLCRHQCGIQDVGKYKVQAVKERIKQINPSAHVETHVGVIENLNKEFFDNYCKSGTVIIGCADNREADINANIYANVYNIPFVSIGFWERAFAGEIFYSIPSEKMPCYECALGSQEGVSARVSTNRRIYTTQEDLQKVNFEPGISVDINFVTIVAIKLILDIMNRDNPQFTPRVIDYLTQFTLVCNTNNPAVGGEMADIFAHPLQITHSIKVDYRENCPPCKYR